MTFSLHRQHNGDCILNAEAWVGLATMVLFVLGGMWRFGYMLTRLEVKMEGVSEIVSMLREGKFSMCAIHTQRLDIFEKSLDQHAKEIDSLWQLLSEDKAKRDAGEPTRVSQEVGRVKAEDGRVIAEDGRVKEEGNRVASEFLRAEHDQKKDD